MRSFLAVFVLALVGVSTTASGSAADEPVVRDRSAVEVPVHEHVLVVGDSIALGAAEETVARFESVGWNASVDAEVSRPTADGIAIVEALGDDLPEHVVVALGANDGGSRSFGVRVAQMLDRLAGVEHVYWVNVAEVRDYYPATNRAIEAGLARRSDMVVLDWNAMVAGNPHFTHTDGLHLAGPGQDAFASLVNFGVITHELDQQRARRVKRVVRGSDRRSDVG